MCMSTKTRLLCLFLGLGIAASTCTKQFAIMDLPVAFSHVKDALGLITYINV